MAPTYLASKHVRRYEEWLLKGREENPKDESNQDKGEDLQDCPVWQLLWRSACPLQAAMLGEADVAICTLLNRTLLENDRDARTNFSTVTVSRPAEFRSKAPTLRMVDPGSVDVDAFFEEFPECQRHSTESFDSDSDEEEDISKLALAPAAFNSTQAPGLGSTNEGATVASDQQSLANPYKMGANHASHLRQPDQPSRTTSYQHPQSSTSRPIHPPHERDNGASWDDVRQAHNPFQTAREYASTETQRKNDKSEGQVRQAATPEVVDNPYAQAYPVEQPILPTARRGPSVPESLKRKFQPPKLNQGEASRTVVGRRKTGNVLANAGGTVARPSSSSPSRLDPSNEEELPEELKGLDKELVEKIQNEIMEVGESITFEDIAGLEDAKQTVQEVVCWPMKRPDLFTGLRRGPNGLLMFGPPGTGKTLIGKAIASESGATFFSISSSSLTSKWIGEGEKLVRTLFAVAAYREPAVVFIDEIDSLLTQRKADENEASRRIKTEFLVQLDGTGTKGRVLIIGATNRPQELDDAARRRFVKRLYIPLPARADREILLRRLLSRNQHLLTEKDLVKLSEETDGYSGADLKSLAADAAMGPIRQLGAKALEVNSNDIPPISYKHFRQALRATTPSVAQSDLEQYTQWDFLYGSKSGHAVPDEDDDSDIDNS